MMVRMQQESMGRVTWKAVYSPQGGRAMPGPIQMINCPCAVIKE